MAVETAPFEVCGMAMAQPFETPKAVRKNALPAPWLVARLVVALQHFRTIFSLVLSTATTRRVRMLMLTTPHLLPHAARARADQILAASWAAAQRSRFAVTRVSHLCQLRVCTKIDLKLSNY